MNFPKRLLLIFAFGAFFGLRSEAIVTASAAAETEALPSYKRPADSTLWAKGMGALHQQLAGECYFDEPCHVYFVEAFREYGLLKSSLIALDRRLRCSRIGMAGLNSLFLDESGHLHEDLDAYRYRKTKVFETPVPSSHFDVEALISKEDSLAQLFRFSAEDDSLLGMKYFSEDYDFAQYLLSLNLRSDLDCLLRDENYLPSDTLHFMRGWTAYLQQDLPRSAAYFSLVDTASVFWEKSLFHEVAMLAHMKCYTQAEERLKSYREPTYEQLKVLQRAGLSLLRNDMDSYKMAASSFDTSHSHYLQSEQAALQSMYEERIRLSRKSPWLAASMSALVPGAGKIYAGNLSEGIMSFVITGAMAGLTAEHWVKEGIDDWRTITFASLTGLFYVSNIFGSYFSVQILQDHVLQQQTQAILYHIHMPLDRLFR